MKNMDTKEIQIIPLKYDFMFKRVFSLNLELLKEFLICVLDLDVEAKWIYVKFLDTKFRTISTATVFKFIPIPLLVMGPQPSFIT